MAFGKRFGRIFSSRFFSYSAHSPNQLSKSPFEIILHNDAEVASVLNGSISKIRNMAIIAHIDHGKSTLADRLLEYAGNLNFHESNKQVLDSLLVEKERGITVKAQTASMFYKHTGPAVESNHATGPGSYLINLIDTPGHVDFSYEVSRSLAACQGVLMLVDSTQGIQAQTLANYYLALEANLDVVPVITKMDLPNASPKDVALQIENALGIPADECLAISSKTGLGIEAIFTAIVNRIKPPVPAVTNSARALLFDSWFDVHRGVIALFNIVEGEMKVGDFIASYHNGNKYQILDMGLLTPAMKPLPALKCGQVGYIVANIRDSKSIRLGDTFYVINEKDKPDICPKSIVELPGFKPAKSMVYAGLYPINADEFDTLSLAIEKLTLNDASVSVARETSVALGMGFRCGFLGVLHMEVFHQRLEQDFGASVICTAPTVPYSVKLKTGEIRYVSNPADFPESSELSSAVFEEPLVSSTIIAPVEYIGALLDLCQNARGVQKEIVYLSETSVMLKYTFPLNEILSDFYSQIKSVTAGFASFDFEDAGTQESDIVKLDILINDKVVDALSAICHRSKADALGKKLCHNLKEHIDRQNFEIIIQARCGKQFVGRDRISPYRKDVLIKSGKMVGGGDVTRKKKLLEKQKEGKKKMKMIGDVEISQEAIWSTFRNK